MKALAAAGAGTGRIHLVRVPEPVAPAEPPHNLDVGLVGIDLYARDIEAAHAGFSASGRVWTATAAGRRGPATWRPPWNACARRAAP
ncbi:hypothetical protein ACQEUU_13040 [Nonomuraea sp. CA-218870]|uniref:hypothetical protein n=1 Tax=Nonomuraea sp. CA-218870 TaxID=3239998 RepID=UPI003D8D640F